jgi:hypothetical protein
VSKRTRLWHVTVTVAGEAMEPLMVRAALARLSHERPFISAMRFNGERAEITYWDEAELIVDAGSLALRLWNEHRESARLPDWEVIGLEIVERTLHLDRSQFENMNDLSVAPQPF